MAICLEVTAVTPVQGTSITLAVAEVPLVNRGCYVMDWCVYAPDLVGTEFVYIDIGGTSYNVVDKLGNWVQIGQMPRCQRLRLAFGAIPADEGHFKLLNDIRCTPCIRAVTGEA